MNLISVTLLSILISPAFAGLTPAERQSSLLDVVSPMYQRNEDVRLAMLSEAEPWLKAVSDEGNATDLELGPSLPSPLCCGYSVALKKEGDKLNTLLIDAPNFDSFIHHASRLRHFINPTTFSYTLKTAAFGRDDLSDLWFPPLWQTNSRSFFTEKHIAHAVQQSRWNTPNMDIENFNTGTFADPEYRTAWFREDIGLNEMHGKINVLEHLKGIDTFHFFTQLLARYEAERFAAGLPKVKRLGWSWSTQEDKELIVEGYDPHLATPLGDRRFAARPAGMKIQDNLREPENPNKNDMFVYCSKQLRNGIRSGFVTKESGEKVPITMELINQMIHGPVKGIQFGCKHGLHPLGHNLLSVVTDPDGRYKQGIGVLGVPETAMRDPVFYTYHRLIYSLYDMYQMLLPAYSKADYEFPGIVVNDVSVISLKTGQRNMLDTFMESAETQILYDQTLKGWKNNPVKLNFQRLNHDDFEYTIKVKNANPSGSDVQAVVRIFIAPHNDDTRTSFRSLNEQRRFFIEMDKFIVTLNKGDNVIKRSSTLSSIGFPSVDTIEDWTAFVNTHGLRRDRFMGCGWPANLMLPRGTPEGMSFDLFVMLTDWNKDKAETADPHTVPNLDFGSSLCGIKGSEYPDGRSRGFPFDRKFEGYQVDLAGFAGDYDNVFVGSLKITHYGKCANNEK